VLNPTRIQAGKTSKLTVSVANHSPGGAGLVAGQTGLSVVGVAIPLRGMCRVIVDVTTTKAGARVGRASDATSSVGNVTSQLWGSLTVEPGPA
jgi:hypothetical protein